ncbi:MAG: ABC transporter permease [Mycobacteriaceae bacterium]
MAGLRNLSTLTWLVTGRARHGRGLLAGTAAGIAVGTALLLLVFAAFQAMSDRAERADAYASIEGTPVTRGEVGQLADDEFLVLESSYDNLERFGEQKIRRVDVAAPEGSDATLPGLDAVPRDGEYAASPELTELIDSTPDGELGDRYGVPTEGMGDGGMTGPDSLVVVVGHDPGELAQQTDAVVATELTGESFPSDQYAMIALIGAAAVLTPVAILIGVVTRLGQSARAERFRTLKLLGATQRRVASISALETGTVAVLGSLASILLYRAALPLAARIPVEGERFFVSDLAIPWPIVAGATVVIVVVSVATAFVSAYRNGSPERGRTPERRPSVIRILPLLLAAVLLGTRHQLLLIPAFLLMAAGILAAGPLVLSWISRWGARRARTAEEVLALNRLARHPTSSFRTVSGLVIAVFIVTVFAVGMTAADDGTPDALAGGGEPGRDRLADDTFAVYASGTSARAGGTVTGDSAAAVGRLGTVDGVESVYPAYDLPPNGYYVLTSRDATELGLDLPDGAFPEGAVSVNQEYINGWDTPDGPELTPVSVEASSLDTPGMLIVNTDGTSDGIERTRTAILADPAIALDGHVSPTTVGESRGAGGPVDAAGQYAGLAMVGIVVASLISVAALAISLTSGVIDRQRALGLLRLTGMPASRLRRMISWEAFVPVAGTFLLCIGLGVFSAWAVVTGVSASRAISWPGSYFYLSVGACLVLAVAAVATTFRTATRRTAVSATRFE